MPSVKGSSFASRILWVRLNHGEEGVERLARAVGPGLRDVIVDGAVMSRWYPFDQFIELNVAIDRVFGRGDLALVKTLGRHGADANLTTIYRLFYRVGTVKWILERASRLWGLHYDSGRLIVRRFPGNEAELEIKDFATPHRVHCDAVHGWAERSLELSGGRDIAVDAIECRAAGDARCRFRARWR
ncbi:MAG: hypothetical protein D6689_09685 [Deltaproteobacteria bacterium]|nr:MAG: hypothetical protein D6689_09685 [Deltaproteobacteria bacterium]